jgi:tripartite-type tricarboxylate transporter receptor subunit TctC
MMGTAHACRALLAIGLMAGLVPAALGQAYPAKPVTVVLGIGAGSTTDVLARLASRRLADRLKQPVVVDNKPGAGGTIAAAAVAAAPADGYTLLFASSSIPLFPHMYDNLRFDPVKDLVGVGTVAEGGLVMLTRPNAPWKNLAELIEYGKSKPKGTITYASAGIGSNAYLFSEMLAQFTGLEFVHVPYKGSSAALADVLAGQVDFVFDGPATGAPQVESGRVRALGFSTAKRSATMPNTPTIAEAGVKGFAQRTWVGFFAPAATPKPVVDRISAELEAITATPEFRKELAAAFHEPLRMSAGEFTAMVRKETEEWGPRLKNIKLK